MKHCQRLMNLKALKWVTLVTLPLPSPPSKKLETSFNCNIEEFSFKLELDLI